MLNYSPTDPDSTASQPELLYASAASRGLTPQQAADVAGFLEGLLDREPIRSRGGFEAHYLVLHNLRLDLLERAARWLDGKAALDAQIRFDRAMVRVRQQRADLHLTATQALVR
jgi:hypothetical protein